MDFKGTNWPQERFGGWAGGYYTLHCKCGTWCFSDKRAWQCYPCAVKDDKRHKLELIEKH